MTKENNKNGNEMREDFFPNIVVWDVQQLIFTACCFRENMKRMINFAAQNCLKVEICSVSKKKEKKKFSFSCFESNHGKREYDNTVLMENQ